MQDAEPVLRHSREPIRGAAAPGLERPDPRRWRCAPPLVATGSAAILAEPLSPPLARKLIREIVAAGGVVFSRHALEEMAKDRLSDGDAGAVLRGGVVEPAELERGSRRYRMRAGQVYAVVTFRSEAELVVVTVWRVK